MWSECNMLKARPAPHLVRVRVGARGEGGARAGVGARVEVGSRVWV